MLVMKLTVIPLSVASWKISPIDVIKMICVTLTVAMTLLDAIKPLLTAMITILVLLIPVIPILDVSTMT
jgi:hypothetical protein